VSEKLQDLRQRLKIARRARRKGAWGGENPEKRLEAIQIAQNPMRIARIKMFLTVFYVWSFGYIAGIMLGLLGI